MFSVVFNSIQWVSDSQGAQGRVTYSVISFNGIGVHCWLNWQCTLHRQADTLLQPPQNSTATRCHRD